MNVHPFRAATLAPEMRTLRVEGAFRVLEWGGGWVPPNSAVGRGANRAARWRRAARASSEDTEDLPRNLAQLPANLPCAVDASGGLEIGALPNSEVVRGFMHALLEPYNYEMDGRVAFADSSPWWREFDDSVDIEPGRGSWANRLSSRGERDLLDVVCGILRSNLFGPWARALRENEGTWYPEGWGPRGFNAIMDRLLGRVGINHAYYMDKPRPSNSPSTWDGGPKIPMFQDTTLYQVDWSIGDASSSHPSVTVFALPHAGNPWNRLRAALAGQRSRDSWLNEAIDSLDDSVGPNTIAQLTNLLAALQSTLPEISSVYSYPCDWNVAQRFGLMSNLDLGALQGFIVNLGGTQVAAPIVSTLTDIHSERLPASVLSPLSTQLHSFFDDAIAFIHRVAPNGITNLSVEDKLRLFSYLGAMFDLGRDYDELILVRILDFLGIMESVIVYVDAANTTNTKAHRALANLLMAVTYLARIPDGERGADNALVELLGVNVSEMKAITQSMDDRVTEFAGFTEWSTRPEGPPTPLVYLDDCFRDYADQFDDFEENHGVPDGIAPGQEWVAIQWEAWWFQVSPVVQALQVFDMVGRMVRALVSMDDAVAAGLPVFINATGTLGTALGSSLAAANAALTAIGLPSLSSALRVLDLPRILGGLARQILTDVFIEHMVREKGASRECLYSLACWMDSEEKRALANAVFGEVVSIETPPELADALVAMTGEVPTRIWVRMCVTSKMFNETSVDRGALGDLFWGAVNPGRAAANQNITAPLVGVVAMLSAQRQWSMSGGMGNGQGRNMTNQSIMRRWLRVGTDDCLCRFRDRWEPDWAYGETHSPQAPEEVDETRAGQEPL